MGQHWLLKTFLNISEKNIFDEISQLKTFILNRITFAANFNEDSEVNNDLGSAIVDGLAVFPSVDLFIGAETKTNEFKRRCFATFIAALKSKMAILRFSSNQ